MSEELKKHKNIENNRKITTLKDFKIQEGQTEINPEDMELSDEDWEKVNKAKEKIKAMIGKFSTKEEMDKFDELDDNNNVTLLLIAMHLAAEDLKKKEEIPEIEKKEEEGVDD